MTLTLIISKLCQPSQLEGLISFIAGKGCTPTEASPVNPHPADKIAGVSHLILFYRNVFSYLTEQMSQGVPPTESLEIWCHEAECILDIYRRNRRGTSLISQEEALHGPEECKLLLQDRLGRAICTAKSAPKALSSSPENLKHLSYSMLAAAAVTRHSEAQSLLAELEACSLPFKKLAEPEVNATYHAVSEQLREKEEQLNEAQSGKEALKRQLTKVEAAHTDSLSAATKEIDVLAAKLLDVQEETEKLILARQERDSVASENSQLVDQLLSAQEELEQRFSSYAKLGHEKDAMETRLAEFSGQVRSLEQKLELKRKKLEVIQASASWKAAAPLRLLTRPFKKKTNEERSTQQQVALVRASDLFDADWYLVSYPDVASSGISPEEHFVRYGGFENRLPGPAFNTSVYFSRYPDVSEAGMNPLVHYLKFGAEEQREIN